MQYHTVNKCDLLSADKIEQVYKTIRTLQKDADIIQCIQGKVNPEILEDWDEKYGDRLNQIVFIGKNLDRDQIISRLQICLQEKSLA